MVQTDRTRSIRDPRNPLMKSLVQASRMPLRGHVRVGGSFAPLELQLAGNPFSHVGLYLCPRCHYGYSGSSLIGTKEARNAYAREQALRCCLGRCIECQTPTKRHYQHCEACYEKRFRERKDEWAARAKVIPFDPTAPHYTEHLSANEGYVDNLEHLIELLIEAEDDEDRDPDDPLPEFPPYLIPCTFNEPRISLQSVEEPLIEELSWDGDDVLDRLNGLDELRAAIAAFNAANKGNVVSWQADYSRVVIFDADYFNRRFGSDRNGLPKVSWSDRPPSIRPHIAKRYAERVRQGRAKAEERSRRFHEELRRTHPYLYPETKKEGTP